MLFMHAACSYYSDRLCWQKMYSLSACRHIFSSVVALTLGCGSAPVLAGPGTFVLGALVRHAILRACRGESYNLVRADLSEDQLIIIDAIPLLAPALRAQLNPYRGANKVKQDRIARILSRTSTKLAGECYTQIGTCSDLSMALALTVERWSRPAEDVWHRSACTMLLCSLQLAAQGANPNVRIPCMLTDSGRPGIMADEPRSCMQNCWPAAQHLQESIQSQQHPQRARARRQPRGADQPCCQRRQPPGVSDGS